MLELTKQQRQAVRTEEALRLIDPETKTAYVLVRAEVFKQLGGVLRPQADEPPLEIPPGIRRSQQAFWRDLPELLQAKRNRGRWVAYYGDVRLGMADDKVTLLREIANRRIPNDAYYIATVRPREQPPWEPEDIESLGLQHLNDPRDEP